jgi:hypothetical protein
MGLGTKYGVAVTLAAFGLATGMCRAADPAVTGGASVPSPAGASGTDTTETPARPETPDEQALHTRLDTMQGQMAAAVSAGHPEDYETALDRLAMTGCRFYAIGGQEASRTKYLGVERAAIAAQGPGLTETFKTQTVTITGSTALATSVATEDQEVTDTTGQFGPQGRRHHWQRQTFYRVHLVATPGRRGANAWKAQQIAVTNIQLFLDGNPYQPPARTTPAKRAKKKATTRKPRTHVYRPSRYIVVGPGMIIRR